MTIELKAHRVLGKMVEGTEIHALTLLEGNFSGIVFSYTTVNFEENEQQDHLKMKFEYVVHEVPEDRVGYDKKAFEQELGDFLIQLLMYGLERDKLGIIGGAIDAEN